MDDPKMIVLC